MQGVVNSDVFAVLGNGDILQASITLQSQKKLALKLGDEVYFIFKAPKVIILKDINQNSLMPNLIKAKVTSAKIGAINSQISALTTDNQELTAIITNEAIMDLRLNVNDEIVALVNPSDIMIAI